MRRIALELPPLIVLLALCTGCVEQKPAEKLTTPGAIASETNPATTPAEQQSSITTEGEKAATPDSALATDGAENSVASTHTTATPSNVTVQTATDSPQASTDPTGKIAEGPRLFDEAAYIPQNPIGLVVIHPQQFFRSPLGTLLKEFAIDQRPSAWSGLFQRMKLRLTDIERITIIMDQPFVNSTARQVGLVIPETPARQAEPDTQKHSMKRIALGFHNYESVYAKLPRANGDGDGEKTGLSWRVHLLPYIEYANLYNEFHLDEPWDSDHNRTLIAKMPALFKSPGVTDEGKTAIHIFTGEKTLFHGDRGSSFSQITDGTSNTILAVMAGPDTAEVWTKPGGLEVDFTAPKKALGRIEKTTFLALRVDGAVTSIPASIDDETLSRLIQPSDGNPVDIDHLRNDKPGPIPPSMILRLPQPAVQDEIVNGFVVQPVVTTLNGQAVHHNDRFAVWFPDRRTVVMGTIESVKEMVAASQTPQRQGAFEKLRLDCDLSARFDLESQSTLIREISKWNPMLGMINNVNSVAVQTSMSFDPAKPLINVELKARDAQMAIGLSTMIEVGLNQLKQAYQNHPLPPTANDSDREMRELINRFLASTKVSVDRDQIQIRSMPPEGIERILVLLRPTLVSDTEARQFSQEKQSLRQIGLAFHNFHDSHNAFPGAGRIHASRPVGLSWRVYLLPFLEHADLYQQFKLDEPWDSEHNKTLIKKMPEVFRSPGVTDQGKTSFHVFVGNGTAFADDRTPNLREITDGSSNTILVVMASQDAADFWTKPGGLPFDSKNPIEPLGKMPSNRFLALFFSGEVKTFATSVKPEILRRMIQHNDGQPIE